MVSGKGKKKAGPVSSSRKTKKRPALTGLNDSDREGVVDDPDGFDDGDCSDDLEGMGYDVSDANKPNRSGHNAVSKPENPPNSIAAYPGSKNAKAQLKSMMHTSTVIMKEKARLRKRVGLLTADPEPERNQNRGQQRQKAHQYYQDHGNCLQVLTEAKRVWLLQKRGAKEGVKLACKYHNGEFPR
jgi:hypothetical protein